MVSNSTRIKCEMNNLDSKFSYFHVITHQALFHAQASLKFASIGAGAFFAAFLRKHTNSNYYAYCITRNTIFLNIKITRFTHTCNLPEVACWVITGERQAARIRGLYLKAILRQDISFFDKDTNSGEVVGRMSGDTVLIQEAMGEKVLMDHYSSPKSLASHQEYIFLPYHPITNMISLLNFTIAT